MVSRLATALTAVLLDLEQRLLAHSAQIEQWFRGQWQDHTPAFYASVDLRNSGYKLAPVDTNLFPGGFNNLSESMLPLAVQAAMTAIERICPDARNLLLVPESHTRNLFYLANVARLSAILGRSGLTVRIGSLLPEIQAPTAIGLPGGDSVVLEPLKRLDGRLGLEGFDPCAILLNNDLSAGVPEILRGLDEQVVIPPLHAGWHARRKSRHFAAYAEVGRALAEILGIDPWFIVPDFERCGSVNFHSREGQECLVSKVDALLARIRAKYREHGIDEEPFVVVKADAGTYGMGILMVRSPEEVRELNRKQRNKMAVGKEGLEVSEVIIQEGVRTVETVDEHVAEPVIYMIDRYVVGGFYRVHAARGRDENLNSPGMQFRPLPFEAPCSLPDSCANPDAPANRYYAYGVVARLALVAAALELERGG
ncbi:MAG: glutamate--cysteine ligase [Rhodocyclaceae bacterium]